MRIEPDHEMLARLAEMLHEPRLPVQAVIARESGVDQPMVSRAARGELVRVTARVIRLTAYVESRITQLENARIAGEDVERRPLHGSPAASRQSGGAARRTRSFDAAAIAGLKAYLADGYDPRLIVEQIAVLRRAQRVRRPERKSSQLR